MRKYPHLAYASGKAWTALRMLCVPNVQQKTRILNAQLYLYAVPRGGIPNPILRELRDLDDKLLAEPRRRYSSETLPQANIREMSWKKHQDTAEKIAFICSQIFEACGANGLSALT